MLPECICRVRGDKCIPGDTPVCVGGLAGTSEFGAIPLCSREEDESGKTTGHVQLRCPAHQVLTQDGSGAWTETA